MEQLPSDSFYQYSRKPWDPPFKNQMTNGRLPAILVTGLHWVKKILFAPVGWMKLYEYWREPERKNQRGSGIPWSPLSRQVAPLVPPGTRTAISPWPCCRCRRPSARACTPARKQSTSHSFLSMVWIGLVVQRGVPITIHKNQRVKPI